MNAEIEEHIRKNVAWTQLPSHIKQMLGNDSRNYDKVITSFSIKNQLRYRGNLVKNVVKDEKRYYERIIAFSRERLMLFPYHLADMVVKGLRITPFNYYVSVVEKLMQSEKSYDTLPNFTAADCLRLLGIGRNEYIDLMNKSRSNRGRLFGRRNVRGLLPAVPPDIHIEPWWRIEIGMVLEEDIKMVNEEELQLIDRLIDYGSQTAGELNYFVVLSLYKKGLIYIDVPITGEDCIQVPPLQGFVMNRVLGDYFETLLYKIFVSIDEHTTVGELAGVLQVETELVKQAVSLYCRLRFAKRFTHPTISAIKLHPSWQHQPIPTVKSVDITPLTLDLSSASHDHDINVDLLQSPQSECATDSPIKSKSGQRIAFLFDSTLTAFLMMGNLSPGLKKHAVTMFEVGKLCAESIDSFLIELEKVSVLDAEGEGEARRYFEHAVLLRSTILALRKLPTSSLDLVRLESLHSLDDATCLRLLKKKYKLLVSMAPLSREVKTIAASTPPHFGPASPEVNSLWFKLYVYHTTGYGPPSLLLVKGTVLKHLPKMFHGFSRVLITAWIHEPAVIPIANILHVNAALQYSPVLIQAYGVHSTAETQVIPFPMNEQPDSSIIVRNKHPALKHLHAALDFVHNCGYLTFVNIGVPDLGCPNNQPPKHVELVKQSMSVKSTPQQQPVLLQKLQSPVETHFALTPQTSSPSNGFTSSDCSAILQQELDRLEAEEDDGCFTDTSNSLMKMEDSSYSLLSPLDETISMFSLDCDSKMNSDEQVNDAELEDIKETTKKGETWTLLDCHFGVPLFDADANTQICDRILYGGLSEPESLEKLKESNQRLSDNILEFISQCQYFPGEHMGILKRGRLTPLPNHSLVFVNGRISKWTGK